jgi:hypothetical protein
MAAFCQLKIRYITNRNFELNLVEKAPQIAKSDKCNLQIE